MRAFLDAVDQAYRQFDEDRHSSERSQELSSRELQEANSHMRAVFQAVPDAFVPIDARGTIGVAPGPGARPEPRHILLVDDDSKQLDALKRHFHALRDEWTLTTAADGRAALKLVAETSFDFIVTDMLMPTLDGIEVVMALRRQRSEARIGAISGGGRRICVDTLECARLLGAERTPRKPFAAEALIQVVRELLNAPAVPSVDRARLSPMRGERASL